MARTGCPSVFLPLCIYISEPFAGGRPQRSKASAASCIALSEPTAVSRLKVNDENSNIAWGLREILSNPYKVSDDPPFSCPTHAHTCDRARTRERANALETLVARARTHS